MEQKSPFDAKIDQAQKEGYFLKTDGSGKLKLSSAVKRGTVWKDHPDWVYNVQYRLVGTADDVENFLRNEKLDEADIADTMAGDLITIDNYLTDMASVYEAEIEGASKTKTKSEPAYNLANLREWAENNSKEGAKEVKAKSPVKAGKKAPATKGKKAPATKGKRVASPKTATSISKGLIDRVAKYVSEGAVMDVSKITETGSNAGKAKVPGAKSKKVGVAGLDGVVSNNYASYKLAMDLMGPSYSQFADKYAQLYGTGPEAVIAKTSVLSPRGRKTAPRKQTQAPASRSPSGSRSPSPAPQTRRVIPPAKSARAVAPAGPPRAVPSEAPAVPLEDVPAEAERTQPPQTRGVRPPPTKATSPGGGRVRDLMQARAPGRR